MRITKVTTTNTGVLYDGEPYSLSTKILNTISFSSVPDTATIYIVMSKNDNEFTITYDKQSDCANVTHYMSLTKENGVEITKNFNDGLMFRQPIIMNLYGGENHNSNNFLTKYPEFNGYSIIKIYYKEVIDGYNTIL